MIISNEKMNKYCNGTSSLDLNAIKGFEFTKLGDGYFFVRMVDENVMKVARIYSISKDDDWAGFEYGTNKIHLEDELQGTISEITFASVKLVKFLFDRFKERFPAESPVFWLSCNEFTELATAPVLNCSALFALKIMPALPLDAIFKMTLASEPCVEIIG